jgi:hypothetical protein
MEWAAMIYFLALIPATALTIGGYFVLFLSNRSEGAFRAFGKYLGFWAFTLAALVILGSIFAAAAHGRHYGCMMGGSDMPERMHGFWPHDPRLFAPHRDEESRDAPSDADSQNPAGTPKSAPPNAAPH